MADERTTCQLVVFALAGEAYGLPITHVHEIIRYATPRPVSSADPCVRGVISLRGKIVPVYDLAARLGLASDPSERAKIVIVDTGEDMAGVVVDDVDEVLTVDEADFEDVPPGAAGPIETIAKVGDRLVIVLHPSGVLGGGQLPVAA